MSTHPIARDDRGRRWIGVATLVGMLAAIFAVLPVTGAQAGLGGGAVNIQVASTGNDTEPEFTYSYTVDTGGAMDPDAISCATEIAVYDADLANGSPEPLDTPITVTEDGDTSGTFTLPELGGGYYGVQVATCTYDGEPPSSASFFYDGEIAFARLLIDKVVEGDAPEGASYAVEAACTGEFEGEGAVDPYERTFDTEGGSTMVVLYSGAVCEVVETEDGGAESTSIDNPVTDFLEDPIDLSTTVTNTFPEAEEVEEEEDDEDDTEEEIEVGADEDEAEPAEPVEAEPDYTG